MFASTNYATRPQQFLYFFPLPHGQGSLRPTFGNSRRTGARSSFISPSPLPPAIAIAGCGRGACCGAGDSGEGACSFSRNCGSVARKFSNACRFEVLRKRLCNTSNLQAFENFLATLPQFL